MPTPADFGLLYEDLTLETVDGIKINCYLLLQRKEIAGVSPAASTPAETSAETSAEVSARRPPRRR